MDRRSSQISLIESVLMIMLALLYDSIPILVTLLTSPIGGIGGIVAGYVVWPFAWLSFGLWFTMRGVKFTTNKKRLATFTIAPLLEFIPYLNNLPAWTFMVVITIITVRAEKILSTNTPAIKKFTSQK